MLLVRRRSFSCSSAIAEAGGGGAGGRALAKPDQRLRERRVGVHRYVAADVVKDVRFGQVFQLRAVADGDRRGELAPSQAVEKNVRRDVAADGARAETGQRLQELVDLLEPRDALGRQVQLVEALQESLVRVTPPAILHPPQQPAPRRLVVRRVELVRLMDVDVAVRPGLLDERGLGRGEARRRRRRFGREGHGKPSFQAFLQ
jgi:hypothetical protein